MDTTAQDIQPARYQGLRYRLIGPFRASRTVGGVGIPSRPGVFFVGVNNGGVWKSDDYGRTWNPVFDDAPTGSVGDIAVSPSHPDIIYVGTGEGLHRPDLSVGDGIFKSVDGGGTWSHIGLKDVQQVGRLIVHPENPDIVFVAGLGHPYGANEQRGVFRTIDGGKSWEKVLYVNHNTGAIQVEFDPTNPAIVFADLWEHREGPWENARFSGPNSGLYKSTDGGTSWRKLTRGLPGAEQGIGRIGVGIAPSEPARMYATVDARENAGIYRSNDGGESWFRVSTDYRVYGRGSDFAEIRVHPHYPDVVYCGNIAAYRSDDGGSTWTSIKGAPGGDDYHRIWINPLNPDIMLFVADQGAVVTVNGGRTFSSWYNQPTAQLYHVTTDNQFPYWVYGGQQESGAIGIASRGNGGQLSFRDWMGVSSDEYAYVAPDPKDPDIIYGGRVMRFNKKTGQSQYVGPEAFRSGDYRYVRTMPLMFHPADPSMLLFATNVLWKTTSGGRDWEVISPDLTRVQPEVPASIGDFITPDLATMKRRAVIYAVGPSPLDVNTIWAGSDDGMVQVTRDGGKTWKDVTPSGVGSWDKISQIDASHFDVETAYIAVNAIRKDDMRPHIYRTRDGGRSWKSMVDGMPLSGPVNVVREDPLRQGLCFAGTEREVFFSSDDGGNWQSLRMSMPASSIRDLVIKDNDLVVGTHGRSIWILDNISPLRELATSDPGTNHLFQPADAYRVRWNMFMDTPLPPEEPAGQNPPDGAIVDYYLAREAREVKLEVLDQQEKLIRSFSSNDPDEGIDTTLLPHPTYWIRPQQRPGTGVGHHRFVWDLRHEPPPGSQRQFSISAVYYNTPAGPHGPFVAPGSYKVRLSVDGSMLEKSIVVKLDPRVTSDAADIALQTRLSSTCYEAYKHLQTMRDQMDGMLGSATLGSRKRARIEALRGKGKPGNPDIQYGSITEIPPETETITGLQQKYLFLLEIFQSSDERPTSQAEAGLEKLLSVTSAVEARWQALQQ